MSSGDHHALRAAITALGVAAGARRDGAAGNEAFAAAAGELGRAWDAAEAAAPGGPLARISLLLPRPEDQLLLALVAAATLQRDDLSLGALLALASPRPTDRDHLIERLVPGQPLLRSGLVVSRPIDGALSVPPPVLAALDGIAPPPPDGATVLEGDDAELAAAVLDALALWPLRPMLNVLAGATGAAQWAVASIAAWARSSPLWRLDSAEVADWRALARDASLADAVVAVDLDGAPEELILRIHQAARAVHHPVAGVHGPSQRFAAVHHIARMDLDAAIDPARVRGLDEVIDGGTGLVATAVEALRLDFA